MISAQYVVLQRCRWELLMIRHGSINMNVLNVVTLKECCPNANMPAVWLGLDLEGQASEDLPEM